MKRKIVIVGMAKSGKRSLADHLEGEKSPKNFSQDAYYRSRTIELPSMYLENTWMHENINVIAQNQGYLLIFMIDALKKESIYPFGFAGSFSIPTMTVIRNLHLVKGDDKKRVLKYVEDLGSAFTYVIGEEDDLTNLESLLEVIYKEQVKRWS